MFSFANLTDSFAISVPTTFLKLCDMGAVKFPFLFRAVQHMERHSVKTDFAGKLAQCDEATRPLVHNGHMRSYRQSV
jgi:hypothetical protein